MTLASCTSESDIQALRQQQQQLTQENIHLRQQLDSRVAELTAMHDYKEYQASLARGCDWIIPLCPESFVRVGRQALANGYAGALSWPAWLGFWGKLLGFCVLFDGCLRALTWVWLRRIRPAKQETAAARAFLARAQQEISEQQNRIAELEEQTIELQTQIAQLQVLRQQSQRVATELQAQIEEAQAQLIRLQSARDALSCLD